MNPVPFDCRSSHRAIVLAALLSALLVGCGTPSPAPRPGAPTDAAPSPSPGRPGPPPLSPLVTEQRWLDEWFRGTPVVIALADVNTLTVDVPLANSFDTGSSVVKPALAAVLDRVATSLRRQPTLRVSIAAPPDAAGGSAALATARAQQVRGHLLTRGVPAARLAALGSARAGAPLQLRMLATPQAIGRLDDATLPVPAAGIRPAAAAPASAVKR